MVKRNTSDWNWKIVADRKAAPNRPKYWGRRSTMGSRHEVLRAPEGARSTPSSFRAREAAELAGCRDLDGHRGRAAVAPEPAMLAVEGSDDRAVVAAALLIRDLPACSLAVGVVIDRASLYLPGVGRLGALAHIHLDLGAFAGLQADLKLLRLCRGQRGLRGRRADDELGEKRSEKARALLGCWRGRRLAGLIPRLIGFRLLGELALDLAHLREAEGAPRAGGVDAVLGRQHDRDEEGCCNAGGNEGRADELSRGRELGPGGHVGVVHRSGLSRLRSEGRARDEVAGQLHADQHEAGAHHRDIGGVGVAPEAVRSAPVAHQDQDSEQSQKLTNLDAHVKGEEVRKEPVRRDLIFLDLSGEAEAMKQAEDQGRELRVRLEAEPALEGAEVVKRLVHDREHDDRVDEIGADADPVEHAEDHRGRMADREEADVKPYVLRPVEEEDHSGEKQEVVVPRNHVLGAEIDEWDQVDAGDFLDIALVALGDGVSHGVKAGE